MAEESEVVEQFTIALDQTAPYEFRVAFDKEYGTEFRLDEPPPLGADQAPNASRILAAAIGNCLSASLLFCAQKSRVTAGPVHTTVRMRIARNPRGRLRIAGAEVEIDPHLPESEKTKARRCLDLFEDYCVVTQSIRQGIPVAVTVKGFDDPQEGSTR